MARRELAKGRCPHCRRVLVTVYIEGRTVDMDVKELHRNAEKMPAPTSADRVTATCRQCKLDYRTTLTRSQIAARTAVWRRQAEAETLEMTQIKMLFPEPLRVAGRVGSNPNVATDTPETPQSPEEPPRPV